MMPREGEVRPKPLEPQGKEGSDVITEEELDRYMTPQLQIFKNNEWIDL